MKVGFDLFGLIVNEFGFCSGLDFHLHLIALQIEQ